VECSSVELIQDVALVAKCTQTTCRSGGLWRSPRLFVAHAYSDIDGYCETYLMDEVLSALSYFVMTPQPPTLACTLSA